MIEKDLTIFDHIVYKKFSFSCNAKEVKAVKINDEIIILKTAKRKQTYLYEKYIYIKLKDEDFLPKLKYFDDKNFILGLSDVGDSVMIYRTTNTHQYNKLLEKFHNEKIFPLQTIIDKLFDKYGLYHNDLRLKNICIDKNNKIRLIDFEMCSKNPRKDEKNNFFGEKGSINRVFKLW